jgi:hypothetical protein
LAWVFRGGGMLMGFVFVVRVGGAGGGGGVGLGGTGKGVGAGAVAGMVGLREGEMKVVCVCYVLLCADWYP